MKDKHTGAAEGQSKTAARTGEKKPSKALLKKLADNRLVMVMARADLGLLQHALEGGADVNVTDANGMTALHHAAALGARPCIRLLVGGGRCDYLIRDNQGRYASDLAIEWARDYAVGRLLTKHQMRQAAERGLPPVG